MKPIRYLLYSLAAALTISGCTFFVMIEWNAAYPILISVLVFFYALFTYSLDHYFDNRESNHKELLHQRHLIGERQYQIALRGLSLTIVVSLYFFVFRPMNLFYIGIGIGLAMLSGIYFLMVFKKKLNKANKLMASAPILTLIISAWPMMDHFGQVQYWVYLTMVLMAISANLLVFGYLDAEYDAIHTTPKRKESTFFTKRVIFGFLPFAMIYIFLMGYMIGIGQSWFFVPMIYLILILVLEVNVLKKSSMRLILDLCMLLPILKWIWN